jgi:hypothetical protein
VPLLAGAGGGGGGGGHGGFAAASAAAPSSSSSSSGFVSRGTVGFDDSPESCADRIALPAGKSTPVPLPNIKYTEPRAPKTGKFAGRIKYTVWEENWMRHNRGESVVKIATQPSEGYEIAPIDRVLSRLLTAMQYGRPVQLADLTGTLARELFLPSRRLWTELERLVLHTQSASGEAAGELMRLLGVPGLDDAFMDRPPEIRDIHQSARRKISLFLALHNGKIAPLNISSSASSFAQAGQKRAALSDNNSAAAASVSKQPRLDRQTMSPAGNAVPGRGTGVPGSGTGVHGSGNGVPHHQQGLVQQGLVQQGLAHSQQGSAHSQQGGHPPQQPAVGQSAAGGRDPRAAQIASLLDGLDADDFW